MDMELKVVILALCALNVLLMWVVAIGKAWLRKLDSELRHLEVTCEHLRSHMQIDEDWTLGRPRPSDGNKPKP